MEFNIDTDKAIGFIERELGVKSARIKVLAILKKNNIPFILSENEAEKYFPPKGYVFEPGFFFNFKHNVNEFVSFYIEENEKAEFGQDKYKLKANASEIKNYGLNARRLTGFNKTKLSTDLSLVQVNGDISDGKFYGITDKYIVGELRINNQKIEPALHHRIKMWDIENENILHYNGNVKLHHSPNGESLVLDCMNDKQLFDWFRDALKKIEPDYVKLLDSKGKWRSEIPMFFSQADDEKYKVDKIRIERIKEKFGLLELSISDIKTLIEKSDSLRDAFNTAIENQKEEWKATYKNEIEDYRKDIERQKKIIQDELILLQNFKSKKEAELVDLKNKIENLSQTIESIKQNKERIIADFSIIKEVLSIDDKQDKSPVKQDSFILEKFDIGNESVTYKLANKREQFILGLKYQLSLNSIFPNFATKLLNVLSVYKAVFLKDIRLGLAFASTTHNSDYVIQQVEPDWLHFSDLWNNGLGAIWQSAHENPERLHFLFLEDINLASPECYARPLLDTISGIRKLIPYGKSTFPINLKILATKISTENPEIGLPLIEQTFSGWGAIGFSSDINKKSDENFESFPGIFNTEVLLGFKPDKLEIEMIESDVKIEFKNLFDE